MPGLNRTMETTEKVSATLSAIMPQLFFDLIARIIPGFAIIWSFYFALLGSPLLNVDNVFQEIYALAPKTNPWFLFLITVLVFYISSIIFYGLWSLLIHTYCFLKQKFSKCKIDDLKRFVEVITADEEFTFRHDFIKLHAPAAGNRITKLKAEIHMSGALTTTFGICFLYSLVGFFGNSLSIGELVLRSAFFLLGAFGLYFANRHFSIRLVRSVGSYSTLLGYEGKFKLPEGFDKC